MLGVESIVPPRNTCLNSCGNSFVRLTLRVDCAFIYLGTLKAESSMCLKSKGKD